MPTVAESPMRCRGGGGFEELGVGAVAQLLFRGGGCPVVGDRCPGDAALGDGRGAVRVGLVVFGQEHSAAGFAPGAPLQVEARLAEQPAQWCGLVGQPGREVGETVADPLVDGLDGETVLLVLVLAGEGQEQAGLRQAQGADGLEVAAVDLQAGVGRSGPGGGGGQGDHAALVERDAGARIEIMERCVGGDDLFQHGRGAGEHVTGGQQISGLAQAVGVVEKGGGGGGVRGIRVLVHLQGEQHQVGARVAVAAAAHPAWAERPVHLVRGAGGGEAERLPDLRVALGDASAADESFAEFGDGGDPAEGGQDLHGLIAQGEQDGVPCPAFALGAEDLGDSALGDLLAGERGHGCVQRPGRKVLGQWGALCVRQAQQEPYRFDLGGVAALGGRLGHEEGDEGVQCDAAQGAGVTLGLLFGEGFGDLLGGVGALARGEGGGFGGVESESPLLDTTVDLVPGAVSEPGLVDEAAGGVVEEVADGVEVDSVEE